MFQTFFITLGQHMVPT